MVGVEEPFSKAAGLSIFCWRWKHANCIIEVLNLNEGSQASNHGFMDWHFFRQSFLDKLQQTWEEVLGLRRFCLQACIVLVWLGSICDHRESLSIKLLDPAEHGVDSLTFCLLVPSKKAR